MFEDKGRFYVRDARSLNMQVDGGRLQWLVYERTEAGSAFVCACLDRVAAEGIALALVKREVVNGS